jgi:hypothetical protein
MTVTLNELLMLVGRLDDTAGFDTPRERFRRFLVEHVTGAQTARTLIEQCQYAPGDQHHRALQDVIVALGRGLGFEPRFGSYQSGARAKKPDGQWHSRRLDIILEIRSDQAPLSNLDALSTSVAALTKESHSGQAGRVLGLCVLTPLYASRVRLDEVQSSATPGARVQVATVRALLVIAGMVGARRLSHDDVVRLLGSGLGLDFIAELLERAAGAATAVADALAPAPDIVASAPDAQASESSFWLATIAADQGATPEEFVELVIGKRQIFGVAQNGTANSSAQPGDRLCLYIPGKGVVGHCLVRSIAEGGTGLRDAHRFSKLLHLEDAVLHVSAPVLLEEEMQLRMRATRADRDRNAHNLMRISQEEFAALTSVREGDERRGRSSGTGASEGEGEPADVPVSAGSSRSPE